MEGENDIKSGDLEQISNISFNWSLRMQLGGKLNPHYFFCLDWIFWIVAGVGWIHLTTQILLSKNILESWSGLGPKTQI